MRTIDADALIKKCGDWYVEEGLEEGFIGTVQQLIDGFLAIEPERKQMTNKEWIDFLSVQFDISRTSAREMLHGMMQCKKEDNYKKQFNKRWEQDGRD